MKRIFATILGLSLGFVALGQNPNSYNYDDVVVLVNANDTASQDIGEYFKNARDIPANHIIPTTTAPNQEHIDSLTFEILLDEIRDSLNARNLDTGINYLVTTKRMPLGVSQDTTNHFAGVPYSPFNASFESELALLNSPADSAIGDSMAINNPYAGANAHHDKQTHGIYLVSRLDGYSLEDIKRMIDNSGPHTIVNPNSAQFIFDQDPSKDSAQNKHFLNGRMDTAHQFLQNQGWNSFNDTDTVYLTNRSNVLGYSSWGSNDQYQHHYTQHGIPNHDWHDGSFAALNVSTSARSFDTAAGYGQSLIADLIANGNTGAAGYVYEPFADALVHIDTFFARYTTAAPNQPYTLAESYFMASPFLSWMDVLVGDPKTSVMTCSEVTVSAGSDTFTCRNRPVELTAGSNITGANFQWHSLKTNYSDSGSSITILPDTTQSFVLTLEKDGCVKKDTVKVRILPEPFDAGKDTVLCFKNDLQLDPQTSDSNQLYFWTPEHLFDNPSQKNPQIRPDSTTWVRLEVIKEGCLARDSFRVSIETAPVITIDETTICQGDTFNLQAFSDTFNNGQYQWFPDSQMSNSQSATPSVFPDSSITYHVLLSNDHCQAEDSTQVKVRQPVEARFGSNVNNQSATFFDSAQYSDSTRWRLGDGNATAGASPYHFNHIYAQTDTFEVCQEAWNPCFSDTACQTIITGTTGISGENRDEGIQIYPNPTNGKLRVKSQKAPLPRRLKLIDNNGKTVLTKAVKRGKRAIQIDVTHLDQGLYYLSSRNFEESYRIVVY